MTLRWRRADPADAQAIAALHAENWQRAYRGILSDHYLDRGLLTERQQLWAGRFSYPEPSQHVVIAEEEGRLQGFACVFGAHDPEHGSLLDNLHVRQTHRGQGLGLELMRSVSRWSSKMHPGLGIHLWALEQNHAARRFYERLGGALTAQALWSPPVGPAVPEVRYSWPDPGRLLADQDSGVPSRR